MASRKPKSQSARKPAKRKAKSTKSKRQKSGTKRFRLNWRLLGKLALVCSVIFGVYLAYLDAVVRAKFEGKKWALPAKVYARPLELYAGKRLKADDLRYELEQLGYRSRQDVSQPGSFSQLGSYLSDAEFAMYLRGFQFWDERTEARKISLRINDGIVTRLLDGRGQDPGVVRLEPLKVGGIYPTQQEDRILVRLQDVPRYLNKTLITVEDQDYYNHWGVSPRGITRAMLANLKAGRAVQGGSTLTQQLVKNFYLTSERSLTRKINEAFMALLLDFHYSKDEILETYLNEIYLGQDGARAIHGFGLASHYYYGRNLKELKLHQMALLVAMVKGPSYYNPRRHPERAMKRRNLVLDMLAAEQVVNADQADWAKRQPLNVVDQPAYIQNSYPAYVDLVRRQLRRDYQEEDLTSEGLNIFTGLDPVVQREAERAMQLTTSALVRQHGAPMKSVQGAMIVTSTDTGDVLAVVGGRNSKYAGFNRALDAVRPVGSVLKPAVYLTALAQPRRYSLISPVDDSEVEIRLDDGSFWRPQNADRRSHGQLPLYQALSQSYNQATARLGMEVGVESVLDTLQQLGIERDIPAYPSVMLGATELTPLEVARMYQTIAANGFATPLQSIQAVTDATGQPLTRYPLEVEQRFDPELIHLLKYALQATMQEGTGRSVYQTLPRHINVAGKTGTTDELRDSWFAGFSGDRLAVVWMGNDDNTPAQLTGSRGALRVWSKLMGRLSPQPMRDTIPTGIEYVWVDSASGRLSGEGCQGASYVPFIKGSQPQWSAPCVKTPARAVQDWVRSWFE